MDPKEEKSLLMSFFKKKDFEPFIKSEKSDSQSFKSFSKSESFEFEPWMKVESFEFESYWDYLMRMLQKSSSLPSAFNEANKDGEVAKRKIQAFLDEQAEKARLETSWSPFANKGRT